MDLKTIKVKPWGEGQGDFVVINESDFDPDRHELFDAPEGDDKAAAPVTAAMLREALDARGVHYKPAASKAQLQALLDEAIANDK